MWEIIRTLWIADVCFVRIFCKPVHLQLSVQGWYQLRFCSDFWSTKRACHGSRRRARVRKVHALSTTTGQWERTYWFSFSHARVSRLASLYLPLSCIGLSMRTRLLVLWQYQTRQHVLPVWVLSCSQLLLTSMINATQIKRSILG